MGIFQNSNSFSKVWLLQKLRTKGSYEGDILKGVITCNFYKIFPNYFFDCVQQPFQKHTSFYWQLRRRVPKPEKPSTFKKVSIMIESWLCMFRYVTLSDVWWHTLICMQRIIMQLWCFLQRLTVIITTTIWFFENNDICSTDIGNEKDDSTNVLDLLFFTENQYC